ACDACRKRKTKCDGTRPTCQPCSIRDVVCVYAAEPDAPPIIALKRKYEAASVENRPNVISKQPNQELFEYLRSSDACHANNVFQRIRSGHDLENILSFIESGDLRKQLDLQPETRFRYELPYVKHMPPELVINNQYLDTLLHDTASLRLTDSESREARPSMSLPQIVYLRPFHAAHVIDPLIESAKPSLWTSVCQDDDIMRRLLRNHFLCEFNFMSALQKDLFLENMNGQHGEFCSSLLVNAVLAYACVCDLNIPNRAEYWNSTSLTYKFLVEAKRLWEIEALTPRISTVQAGIILNGISNLSGLDQIGQTYLKQTIALANRLGLFLDRPIKTSSEKSRQCMIYTAWALFCWDALVAFSIQQPPLLPGPPQEPLPSSSVNPAWYGLFWLEYPGLDHPVDAHFASLFEHRARFRVVLARYCHAVFQRHRSPAWLARNAYLFRTQLVKWFGDLPACLQSGNIVLPAQLQLHMYYHQLMITIFEPLVNIQTHQLPRDIVHESEKCFATLFRLYYIRHGHQNMDIHIIISSIFAGTRCIDNLRKPLPNSDIESLRQTLVMCATGIYKQRCNNFLAQALYSTFLSSMHSPEIMLLEQVSDVKNDEEALLTRQATLSNWIPIVVDCGDDLDPSSFPGC
ncbi:hypothetical protein M436DRAFT_58083, partial [Aureobasidium namibiae CBS 147.97]